MQAFFFKILGINWVSYIIHSSLFNSIIAILTFYFFLSLEINEIKSFIYTVSFSTLSYTISGTPFVDQHATFFLLISTYFLLNALTNSKKNLLWFFSILFIIFSFLSKQVPATYAIILQGSIILFYSFFNKNFLILKLVLISFFSILIIFLLILYVSEIDLDLFITQYLNYPRSIGSERFNFLDKSPEIFFNQFKYLLIPIIFSIILRIKKMNKLKGHPLSSVKYLIILSLILSLIIHQLMTKNQIFIYFLIPIIIAIIESDIKYLKINKRQYISVITILLLVFVTIKYHIRFNENRKFHELAYTNLDEAKNASDIDSSLSNLKWKNPFLKAR